MSILWVFCFFFFSFFFSFFFFFGRKGWGAGHVFFVVRERGRGINPLFYRYFPDKSTHIPNCAVYIFPSSESVISSTWPRCPNCLLQTVWWQCKRFILKIRFMHFWVYFAVDWKTHKKNGWQKHFFFFFFFLIQGFGWLCNISQMWKQKTEKKIDGKCVIISARKQAEIIRK